MCQQCVTCDRGFGRKSQPRLPKSRWRWRRAPDRPCRGPGRVGHERLRRPPRPSHTCKYPSGRPCIPPRAVVARRQVLRPDLGRRASGTLRGPFFPNRNVYSEGPPAARRGTGPVAAGLLYVRHGLGCPNGAHVSRARAPRAGWWPNLDLRWSVGGRSHMGPPRALPVLGLWSRFFVMSASQHDPLSRTTRGSVGEGLKATLYAQTLISWDFTLQVVISSRFWTCPQPVGTSPPGPRSTPGRASASAQVPPPASTRSPRRKARTHAHTRGPSFQMLTSSHHQIESPSVLRRV